MRLWFCDEEEEVRVFGIDTAALCALFVRLWRGIWLRRWCGWWMTEIQGGRGGGGGERRERRVSTCVSVRVCAR